MPISNTGIPAMSWIERKVSMIWPDWLGRTFELVNMSISSTNKGRLSLPMCWMMMSKLSLARRLAGWPISNMILASIAEGVHVGIARTLMALVRSDSHVVALVLPAPGTP